MISTKDREIRKSIVIDAPPDIVFKAITDEKELIEWFPNLAVLEPRVGGCGRRTGNRYKRRKRNFE